MKYKTEIKINDNWHPTIRLIDEKHDIYICDIEFDIDYIKNIGNRYDKDGYIKDEIKEIEHCLSTALLKVHEELGLAGWSQPSGFANSLGR